MQAPEKTRSGKLLRPALKLFFYLLYHPMAWMYDLVAAVVSAGRWKKWVWATVPYLNGPNILELGHGPGHLQSRLSAEGHAIVGIDRSRQMGRQAYRRLSHSQASPQLVRSNANALPFRSRFFNTVIATFPTEYISDPAAISEIYRVLSTGGKLVILLSAWITGGSLLDRSLAVLFRITGQNRPVGETGQHTIQQFKSSGLTARFEWLDLPSSRLLLLIAEK
jgi:SAM-dependent methyltransferase